MTVAWREGGREGGREQSPEGVLEQILLFLQANEIPHTSGGCL